MDTKNLIALMQNERKHHLVGIASSTHYASYLASFKGKVYRKYVAATAYRVGRDGEVKIEFAQRLLSTYTPSTPEMLTGLFMRTMENICRLYCSKRGIAVEISVRPNHEPVEKRIRGKKVNVRTIMLFPQGKMRDYELELDAACIEALQKMQEGDEYHAPEPTSNHLYGCVV